MTEDMRKLPIEITEMKNSPEDFNNRVTAIEHKISKQENELKATHLKQKRLEKVLK